jgi:hypothetical protein
MIVWCMITVILGSGFNAEKLETAAKGKILAETGKHYLVDFSEYATKRKYIGDYSNKLIDKDQCMESK